MNTKCDNKQGKRTEVTQCYFYLYRIAIRGPFNTVLFCGQLTQQYKVDCYVKTERNRLKFIRQNQADLHVAAYNGMMDYLNNRAERENHTVGTICILPSSFIWSPRAMIQGYEDAMAICGKYGKLSYLLTFTCNPKLPEITNSIPIYQSALDRPDVVARVYNLKKNELMDDIQTRQILGKVTARIHVIEIQLAHQP